MAPERIEFLDNVSLRFTPPMDLNDPLECRPNVKFKNPDDYIEQIIKRNLEKTPSILMKKYPHLTHAEAVKVAKFVEKETRQEFTQNIETEPELEHSIIMENINKFIGILSLTGDPFNKSMWDRYASNGSGYTIEFDESNPFFYRRSNDRLGCGEIKPVTYTDQLIEVELESSGFNIPYDLLFTKKKCWSYEKEYRMIRELSMADQIKGNIHLYKVPYEAVSAIIIGYAATDDLINKIQQSIRSWPNANNIKIKRVTIGANGLEYA